MPERIRPTKKEIIVNTGRSFIYEITRPFPLSELPESRNWSPEKVKETSKNHELMARYYYTRAKDALRRGIEDGSYAAATIDLTQELINMSKLRQAEEVLLLAAENVSEFDTWQIADSDRERTKRLFEARILEKRGWIEHNKGNQQNALEAFNQIKLKLNQVPFEERTGMEMDVDSTATHFIGRANCEAGNYETAMAYFTMDLINYQKYRDDRKPRPAGEGYNIAWLARCYMGMQQFDEAGKFVEMSYSRFQEASHEPGNEGILAHYYLVNGELLLRTDNLAAARDSFEKSLAIRHQYERYPRGEALAHFGIAMAYLRKGRGVEAASYGFGGLKVLLKQ